MASDPDQCLHLYGVRFELPETARSNLTAFGREPSPAHSSPPLVRVSAGSVPRPQNPDWSCDLIQRIRVQRFDNYSLVAFDDDTFRVERDSILVDSTNLSRAFDLSYHPLMAFVLPFHQLISLHAFVLDLGAVRIAVLGESGAGKTTMGRELLARGATLVSDDLLALDQHGRAHAGPPFLRIVDHMEGATRDVGGKYRQAVDPAPVPVRPVDLFVVLDPDTDDPTVLDRSAALDQLLGRPYLPMAPMPAEMLMRLEIVASAVRDATTVAFPPRWREPAAMVDQALSMAGVGFIRQ